MEEENYKTMDNKSITKEFKLINLGKGEKVLCILVAGTHIFVSVLRQNTDIVLLGLIIVIALVAYFSVENTYVESEIESSFNLIVSLLANEEKLSPNKLKEKVYSVPLRGNKDLLLIKWRYHKMLNRLLAFGYIDVETDWSQDQYTHYYKITEKGLALAKKQEAVQ